MSLLRSIGVALLVALPATVGACDPPDACDAMCVAARDRFEACLAEDGLEWGASVGYADATDFDDWCATYAWELRQLGRAEQCEARVTTFESGTCDEYHASWSIE